MDLPKLINNLARAQNNLDSVAFLECFVEGATVNNAGGTFNGKEEIRSWIQESCSKYETFLVPLDYSEKDNNSILLVEAHGNFAHSPASLKYHIKTQDGLIQSLKITTSSTR